MGELIIIISSTDKYPIQYYIGNLLIFKYGVHPCTSLKLVNYRFSSAFSLQSMMGWMLKSTMRWMYSYSLSQLLCLISVSCLVTLSRTFRAILNNGSCLRHLCFLPDFTSNVSVGSSVCDGFFFKEKHIKDVFFYPWGMLQYGKSWKHVMRCNWIFVLCSTRFWSVFLHRIILMIEFDSFILSQFSVQVYLRMCHLPAEW